MEEKGGMHMKKRLMLLTMVLLLTLTACGGNVKNVKLSYGSPTAYSQQDVSDAMDVVLKHFRENFKGCTLTELTYDEDLSQAQRVYSEEIYHADEAIVLTSTFTAGSDADISFTPGEYSGWLWILTRSDGGDWTYRDCGY
jgi:hypothetical protein